MDPRDDSLKETHKMSNCRCGVDVGTSLFLGVQRAECGDGDVLPNRANIYARRARTRVSMLR